MSNRAAYALAFACWGAAVGVAIYRVAILGLTAMGDGYGFPVAVVALAVLGRLAVRNQDRPSIPPLIIAGFAGLGLGLAGSYVVVPPLGSSRLSTHQFPGFTLDLPSGDIHSEDRGYPTGKLELAINGATTVAMVQWEPGGAFTDGELETIAIGIGAAAGGTKPGAVTAVDGVPTVEVSTDKGLFEVSMEKCGVRHIAIATGGGGDGVDKLHRRIVASFHCHPDASKEASAAALAFPLVLDVPGWHTIATEPDQTQITDGSSSLLLQQAVPDLDRDVVSFIATLAKAKGIDMTVGAATHGRAPMTLKNGGDSVTGFVQLVPCPTATAVVIAMVPDAKATPAIEAIIDNGRCLKPDEAPQTFAPAPTP